MFPASFGHSIGKYHCATPPHRCDLAQRAALGAPTGALKAVGILPPRHRGANRLQSRLTEFVCPNSSGCAPAAEPYNPAYRG
jgi:hypothetical protein